MASKMSHLQLLGKDNIAFLDKTYEIKAFENMIFIKKKSYNRTVAHDIGEDFLFATDVKSIKFKKDFNRLWYDHFRDKSIFRVLDAYNSILMSYGHPTPEEVEKQLTIMN